MPISNEFYQTFARELLWSPAGRMAELAVLYPHVEYDTLVSIRAQSFQAYFRQVIPQHRRAAAKYVKRYYAGEKMTAIADDVGLSPCELVRLVLLRVLKCHPKDISGYLKEPSTLKDARLRRELVECVATDEFSGPTIDRIRRNIGLEYEFLLEEVLRNRNIPFVPEAQLQTMGVAKTPDILFKVPIAIDGRVVNWIDSKAMFGDQTTHQNYLNAQYRGYVNRFGGGLVIYWFDYLESLSGMDSDVLVEREFPSDDRITTIDSTLIS